MRQGRLIIALLLSLGLLWGCGDESSTEPTDSLNNKESTSTDQNTNSSSSNTSNANETPTAANTKKCGEPGVELQDGILILESGGKCVIMEKMDRAACRIADNFAQCKSWSSAATICPAGLTPGSGWYLPTSAEAAGIWSVRGANTPVSANNLCVADSGTCFADPGGGKFPYFYWTQTKVNDTNYMALALGVQDAAGQSVNKLFSVRCVRKIDPT